LLLTAGKYCAELLSIIAKDSELETNNKHSSKPIRISFSIILDNFILFLNLNKIRIEKQDI